MGSFKYFLFGIATAICIVIFIFIGNKFINREHVNPDNFSIKDIINTQKRYDEADRLKRIEEVLESYRPIKIIDLLLESKIERLINLPSISLHYADSSRIRDLYNDYFREPTTESFVKEMISETSGKAGAEVPKFLEGEIGSKDISKWVQSVKLPETSIDGMFRKYQRETIKNNQVDLTLDLIDIELSELNEFNDIVEKMEADYGLVFESEVLKEKRLAIKDKSAKKAIKRLEGANGTVLVEGKFELQNHDDKYYKCQFKHPVNGYLMNSTPPILISFIIHKKRINDFIAGDYAQSIGKSIPLKVYGEVWLPIDLKNGITELQITPLAVY